MDLEFAVAVLNAMKNRLVPVTVVDSPVVSVLRKRRAHMVRFDCEWEMDYCCTDAPAKVAKTKALRRIRTTEIVRSGSRGNFECSAP